MSIDRSVPRLPDKKPAKYAPVRKRRSAISLFLLVEFLQLVRQKTDKPNIAKEKGIGFPDNNSSLSA